MPIHTGPDPRRICIIKPSALGDVVQTLPLLNTLRDRFPEASISWVINKNLSGLLEGHPLIDELLQFDRKGGIVGLLSLLKSLRSRQFDLVLDLQGLFRTGVMTRATSASSRVGLQTAREGAYHAYTAVVEGTGRDVPARLRTWNVAEAFSRSADSKTPSKAVPLAAEIPLTPADRTYAASRLKALPQPFIAICPGARWATKRWPAQRFAELAARVHRQFGAGVVIVGGPDEQILGQQVEEQLSGLISRSVVVNLVGSTTLRQLSAVLEASTWVAANDSGPMHLADAVGTPVLGIFTCTSPWLSGPSLDRHELISSRVLCAAGYHKSCPFSGTKHQACLGELSVDRAWAGFVRLVAKSHRRAA